MEVLLLYGLLIVLAISVQVLIIRWIFRIDTMVNLLEAIRDQLIKMNAGQDAHESAKPVEKPPPEARPGLLTPRQ